MDLALAESLVAVVDTGSITHAATRIHISQSALSRRLQQLESELGTQLLARGRHGAELTEAGRMVASDCRAILARYEAMRRGLDDLLGLRRGEIALGGGATATSALLPAAIATFRAEHPNIRFVLTEAGSHQVMNDVADGRLVLGVVTLPVSHPEVTCLPLLEDQIVLVARSDDPLHGVVSAGELRGRGLIAFEAGSAIRRIIDAALLRIGGEMDVTMELRSVTAMLQMVEATGDLAFVSRLSLVGQAGRKTLVVRRLRLTRTLALAVRRGATIPPAAETFVAVLTRTAAELERSHG